MSIRGVWRGSYRGHRSGGWLREPSPLPVSPSASNQAIRSQLPAPEGPRNLPRDRTRKMHHLV